jgi:hypothetical protein
VKNIETKSKKYSSYFDLLHAPAQTVGNKTGDTASHNEIGTTDLVPLSCFLSILSVCYKNLLIVAGWAD